MKGSRVIKGKWNGAGSAITVIDDKSERIETGSDFFFFFNFTLLCDSNRVADEAPGRGNRTAELI